MKKSKGVNMDLIAGALCTLVGGATLFASRSYPKLSRKDLVVGADFFPTIVSVGMLVCALFILGKAILKPTYRPAFSKEEKRSFLRVLLTAALCLAYVFVMPHMGFLIASILITVAVMFIYGNRSPVQLALVGILCPLVLFAVFKFVLGVQLPMGWLTFLGV